MRIMTKSLYAVIRVPKSGSSSLQQIVREAYPQASFHGLPHSSFGDWRTGALDRIRFVRQEKRSLLRRHRTFSIDKALRKIDDESHDGDIVGGGHVALATFRKLRSDLNVITLFRDPAARLLSEYNYSRNQYHERFMLNRLDTSFSKKMASRHDLDRYVSIMLEHKDTVGNIACQLLDIQETGQIGPRLGEDLFHFGVLENMADFIDRLSEKCGRPLQAVERNITRRRAADAIDKDTLAKIERLNDLDFELYEQARAMCSAAGAPSDARRRENV